MFTVGFMGFPGSLAGKESACNAGDLGLIPGSERSPREGNSNSLQYSCLENPMDRGAWRATIHGVAKHSTRLNNEHTRGAKESYFLGLTGDTPPPQISLPQFSN